MTWDLSGDGGEAGSLSSALLARPGLFFSAPPSSIGRTTAPNRLPIARVEPNLSICSVGSCHSVRICPPQNLYLLDLCLEEEDQPSESAVWAHNEWGERGSCRPRGATQFESTKPRQQPFPVCRCWTAPRMFCTRPLMPDWLIRALGMVNHVCFENAFRAAVQSVV